MLRLSLKIISSHFESRLISSLKTRFLSTSTDVDLAVIGGGPGGYVAAIKAAQLGMKVVCVEKRGALGGTCLNVGCIPSKALLHSSHMYEEAKKKFSRHGIEVKSVSANIAKLMSQKDKAVHMLTNGIEYLFKKNKVEYVSGTASLVSPSEIVVNLNGEGERVVKANRIIIASGSEPAKIPGIDFDEKIILSSTGALSLDKIPKRMAVIGAGVIGLELGSVWKRLGTEVTVVGNAPVVCPGSDLDVSKMLLSILKKQGMKFKLATSVTGIDASQGHALLSLKDKKSGKESKLEADTVLVAIGRRPYTEGVGIDKIGVKTDRRGCILVDEKFETNIKGIYAIGDVIPGPMLAHKAEEEGVACVKMMAGLKAHVNYDTIPGVIFTSPEVATVGKTEEEMKKSGEAYRVGKFPFSANSRAKTIDQSDGIVKIITEAKTDRVVGCHIIGSTAGEQISGIVIAMEKNTTSEEIGNACHPHPTMSEAIKEAALAAHDKPIHA